MCCTGVSWILLLLLDKVLGMEGRRDIMLFGMVEEPGRAERICRGCDGVAKIDGKTAFGRSPPGV